MKSTNSNLIIDIESQIW